jgi:RNA ligase
MNYKFPIIETLDDVLPHIEGRTEFIVVDKGDYIVVNYVLCKDDTFDITDGDLTGEMRRECRGLIFDANRKLISRPFHKFFNLGEREETQPNVVDITRPHTIFEKADGSMIRPLIIDGHVRLGTKMGVTDVAMQAEEWLASQSNNKELVEWLYRFCEVGLTPLFEFTSPENQIVLEYEKSDLILLAIRDNRTGQYSDLKLYETPFNVIGSYGSVEMKLNDYSDIIKGQKDREGVIISFADGHKIKIKNDWYVRIHKVKDLVRYQRNIIDLVINNELDDVLPILLEADVKRVNETRSLFFELMESRAQSIERMCKDVAYYFNYDRKRIALEHLPTLEYKDKSFGGYIFGYIDGKSVSDMLMTNAKKNLGSNAKWDKFAEWLGM